MIVYDLKCSRGHTFEGWFDSSSSYEEQMERGLVSCPLCDDHDVRRVPSTFAIKSSRPDRTKPKSANNPQEKLVKEVVKYLEKYFDNVGTDFAKEALKIHYGASEPRNIRGVSTDEEEKILKKEGIEFYKIPLPSVSDTGTETETDADADTNPDTGTQSGTNTRH